jgi:osmotically-inducible protein OsmY
MTISQHSAVVTQVKAQLGERFTPGQDVKDYITKADRQAVAAKIAQQMLDGEVTLSDEAKAKYGESAETLASRYVMGMVTNWLNKSKELNGGTKYTTKNPGSRAGSGDEQVREMRKLRKQLAELGNTEGVERVDAAIAQRLAEIGASKTSTVEINAEVLPEALRGLIG